MHELTSHFEQARGHLRAVALRLLGSPSDADDAVQEAWLRASRAELAAIESPAAWLTTITGRVCLDMLRARRRRPEELAVSPPALDAEAESLRVEAVGLALLVVLDRLTPLERVAFVLHDMFGVPFEEVAQVVARTPVAAKKLASRARARVAGSPNHPAPEHAAERRVVQAFLAASQAGDLHGLLAVLAPDVVRRADPDALLGAPELALRGARPVADETRTHQSRARFACVAQVDGKAGLVVAPGGRLQLVIALTIVGDRVVALDVIAEPSRLRGIGLALAPEELRHACVSACR